MIGKSILGAATLAVVAGMAQPAMADTYEITFGGNLFGTFGSVGVTIHDTALSISEGGYAGGFMPTSIIVNGSTTYIVDTTNPANLLWCTDITTFISTDTVYGLTHLGQDPPASISLTPGQTGAIKGLLNNDPLLTNHQPIVPSGTNTDSAHTSAAIQVAIWAAEYDPNALSGSFNVSLNTNTFYVDTDASVVTLANAYLASVNPTNGSWFNGGTPDDYYPINQGASQNLTFASGGGIHNRFDVPEPASMAVLAIGLIGLGAARRRAA